MGTNDNRYYFTDHLIDRLKERFPHIPLQWNNRSALYLELNELMEESVENRSYLNNTSYLCYLHEKYGYDALYEFLVHNKLGIVFVVRKDRGRTKVVKTCFPPDHKFRQRKKFTKKKNQKKHTSKNKGVARLVNETEAYMQYIN